ncbi:hypothetical protein [Nitrosospira sp. NpAV]|uniref:hypothetical protein n=1 Tax=Nitrosospira sp. NpAV TaxID=58133 RepID=UPI000A5B7337|nr:hypothetical protein [Nitrosospira sp. NpAV]
MADYQLFSVQTGTALQETDDRFAFAVATNGDLFVIQKSGTSTHTTEVHILSAESNYQRFIVQTGTVLQETDDRFAFAVAANGDLFVIQKSGTGTHATEVHILSAESNYQRFIVQTGTALQETDDRFAFAVAANRDLFVIQKSGTGTHATEVHILSAESNYQRFIVQTGTALQETDDRFAFAVAANRDLFVIQKSGTGTHTTEVHILSAESNYQRFIVQTGTALHETDGRFAFGVAARRDLFVIQKNGTGTRTTEVHILSAPTMTTFESRRDGFKFANEFINVTPVFDITFGGLCGGMVYSALDYFNAHIPVPVQTYLPAQSTMLESYIYGRQQESVFPNADKWTELTFNPFGARNDEFFNWGLEAKAGGRIDELRQLIDSNKPAPLGLRSCGDDCAGDHQVLAIGYHMGRYKGDLGDHKEDFRIQIYDPNFPNETLTLAPDLDAKRWHYLERMDKKWLAYFVDKKYVPKIPPVIDAAHAELVVKFKTGGDDLRGGNDNVHVAVLFRDGTTIDFPNVNKGRRWIDHSRQDVGLDLPASTQFNDVIGIRLDTTFGGGAFGDNWNLERLTVEMRVGNVSRVRFHQAGTPDSPLQRFTGDFKRREFRFP